MQVNKYRAPESKKLTNAFKRRRRRRRFSAAAAERKALGGKAPKVVKPATTPKPEIKAEAQQTKKHWWTRFMPHTRRGSNI